MLELNRFLPNAGSDQCSTFAIHNRGVIDIAYGELQILNVGCSLEVCGTKLDSLNPNIIFPFRLQGECAVADLRHSYDGFTPADAIAADGVTQLIVVDQIFVIKRCRQVNLNDFT